MYNRWICMPSNTVEYLHTCIRLARAVNLLHHPAAAGRNLSEYKNINILNFNNPKCSKIEKFAHVFSSMTSELWVQQAVQQVAQTVLSSFPPPQATTPATNSINSWMPRINRLGPGLLLLSTLTLVEALPKEIGDGELTEEIKAFQAKNSHSRPGFLPSMDKAQGFTFP